MPVTGKQQHEDEERVPVPPLCDGSKEGATVVQTAPRGLKVSILVGRWRAVRVLLNRPPENWGSFRSGFKTTEMIRMVLPIEKRKREEEVTGDDLGRELWLS